MIALIIPVIIGLVFCIAYFFETGSKSHLFSGCVLFLVVLAAIFAALIMFIGS